MDSGTRKILTELQMDGSRARKTIAANLGISESSLSKRISILKDNGIISRETIDINYAKAGYPTDGITLIKIHNANKSDLEDFIEKISPINEAVEVASTFGDWDLYVRWMASDPEVMMDKVNLAIDDRRIEDSRTIILGKVAKRKRGPAFNKKQDSN